MRRDDQQQDYHVLWKVLHGQDQAHDGLMAVKEKQLQRAEKP